MAIYSKGLPKSWVVIVFVAYLALAAFQKYAIYPIEAKVLPLYAQYASLIFMPHAVRVLATAIYGPKAFFVLFPAALSDTYAFYPVTDGVFSISVIIISIIGAASAPLAFILLKNIGRVLVSGFDAGKASLNWRYVFIIGILASAINSIGLTILFFDSFDASAAALAMLRFFIGDIIGVFVGLVILTRAFRILRKAGEFEV